jgi:hypothetical protein
MLGIAWCADGAAQVATRTHDDGPTTAEDRGRIIMKVILENTTKFVFVGGVECRVWEGATEKGVPLVAFIPRIAVREQDDATEFAAEFKETRAPSEDVAALPARLVL